jgi:hypothetical protein
MRAIVEFLRKAGTQEGIEFQYLTGRKRPHRQVTCVQLPNSCLVAVFPAFLIFPFMFTKHLPGPFGTQEAVITAKEVKRWKIEDRR